MKLKHTFEIVNMGDELIAVPVGESSQQLHGVVKLNKEGFEIIELLQKDITEEDIVVRLANKYENSIDELKLLVHSYIKHLQEYELLDI